MAFDDFLNKVKETSVNAMDKAKDTTKRMATINDLKGQIRSLNNEKNKLFTQMGMDIYVPIIPVAITFLNFLHIIHLNV